MRNTKTGIPNYLLQRAFVAIATVGLSAIIWQQADAGTLEDARAKGFVEIAIANAPPWAEMTSDGEIKGGAPDVAIAVLKRLGIPEVRARVVEYGAMVPGLRAGRFDVIAAGLAINPKRCEAVSFSRPDVCGTTAFAVKKGSSLNLSSFEDISAAGATVAVCGGCVEEGFARAAGVPIDKIVTVPDEISAIKMVSDGRVDAYAYPTLSITALVKKAGYTDIDIVSPIPNTPINCAGAAFRKEDTAFRDAYDAELVAMQESGEFSEILSVYGFPADIAMTVTREELCKGSE
jgi:polar amino acid transport system substrate-binding protein